MMERIVDEIANIIEGTVGVNLFFVLRDGDERIIRRVDIEGDDTADNLEDMFSKRLRADFVSDEGLQIRNLSEADVRTDVIYRYDYDELPEKMQFFKGFDYSKGYEVFSFTEDGFQKIDAILVAVGTKDRYCLLYKKHYPIMHIGQKSFCLIKSDKRFKELKDDVLRINDSYECIRISDEVYITKLEALEKNGAFFEIIEKEANSAVDKIDSLRIIDDADSLRDSIGDDISFARKLSKIGRCSPIIELGIPKQEIIDFSRNQPGLKGTMKYNSAGDRIILDTKAARTRFLKMLDDSFLTSELTRLHYDSVAKDRV